VALHLPDRWIWDFWLADDAGVHHMFYLQAPRSIGDPEMRHWNVSIGHAVSADLSTWEVLPDALTPGPPGSWDDYSTWTGSVICHEGVWHMLYTGTNRAEDGRVQRIGLATSTDLITWERHPGGPVLEADPRWYEILDLDVWFDQAWRDPWVFLDPDDGWFHAFVSARANHGDPKERGVVGHARSRDLINWEVLPPVAHPGGFGELEVPQLVAEHGNWYLVFCSVIETQSSAQLLNGRGSGTYYFKADDRYGPFDADRVRAIQADETGSRYGGRFVRHDEGLRYMAWDRVGEAGFVGSISDPVPVEVDEHGHLVLAEAVTT